MSGDSPRSLSPPDPDWYGPWCSYHAEFIEGGSTIVGEVHQFRRHAQNKAFIRENLRGDHA